jgi:hypothetical protein
MFPLPSTRLYSLRWYAQIEADAKAEGGRAWWEAERWLGRNDLWYLLVRLLRRPDLNHDWLFDRCREVQAAPDGHLDLWAREHYKSTIITFGKTMQDILCNPEITVGIFSHSRPIAKGFLGQIKREAESNDWLKHLYPDVLWSEPHREAPRWSEDSGLIFRRKGNPKESSVEAYGLVDGMPTSKHFTLCIYDDVVDAVYGPDMIRKVTDAWDLSQNLGSKGGAVRYIGTRYSLWDTYATMLERGAAIARIHTATHNNRMDGRPVFLSQEGWDLKLRNSSTAIIASQQLQNPLADEAATFRVEWLRAYEVRPRTLSVWITADPSRGRSATSDNTAIAVIGISAAGGKYLLDGACHRMTLSQRWTALRGLYRKWSRAKGVQHIAVGYERYGAQSDDEYFAEQMDRDARNRVENPHFVIQELNWPREGGNSKKERVERLEPDFRNGRFYLPQPVWRNGRAQTWRIDRDPDSKTHNDILWDDNRGLTKLQMTAMEAGSADLIAKAIRVTDQDGKIYDLTERLISEYVSFPFGRHDDLCDSVSRVYDLDARPPTIVQPGILDPVEHWDR